MPSSAPSPSGPTAVNLFSHDVLVDPYPTYALLRETEPVHWDDRLNGWVLTRHSDVHAAHLDPDTFSSQRLGAMVSDRVGPDSSAEMQRFMQFAPEWMLFRDSPDHARVRKLMNREFRARDIRRRGPGIRQIVAGLVDDLLEKQEFDLVADFSYKLPGLVLAAQYGLPESDAALLTDWWYEIRNMQRVFLGADPADVAPTGSSVANAFGEMVPYLGELIKDRRRTPRDDLATRVVEYARETPEEGEERLSEQEMFAHLLLLPLASFGTTMDLIGNGLLGLFDQRDQWELLKSDPTLVFSAVEEVLRYDASVQLTHRVATRDTEVAGTTIREGELIYMVRGAANRDPERWTDPDRIDITRGDSGHVGFGVGIHRCLGAGLAQQVTAAAYAELSARIPDLRADTSRPHRWKADTPQFRGLAEFPATTGKS
ncbi:cytochrome P450 [Streptomyces sp. NPDC002476]|uniref:cytochrome P450 n=1 Tax=Streptomyces sp. NPDC002476 TaxID=3364648 RepID=UPI0036CDB0FB